MKKRQQQVIEAFRRARSFLDSHPGGDADTYGEGKVLLDGVVERTAALGVTKLEAGRLAQQAGVREVELTRALRDRHLRPIARIAKSALRGVEGGAVALRMPRGKLRSVQLIADAQAIRNAAAPHAEVFVRHSMAPDFLVQLDQAIAALGACSSERAARKAARKGACDGLAEELLRGRDAIEILDSIVRQRFAGNAELLGEWEAAKRVQRTAGRAAGTSRPAAA